MAKALITGIAGFIGSSLARGLLAAGCEVIGIDNLSSGKDTNLESIRSKIDYRDADIADAGALEDACRGVDFVFHEAAIASVPISVADPIGSNIVNLTGTLLVLEAARHAGVKRVVFASSSAVYGDCAVLPKREAMLPAPVSPYAAQKMAGEHYLAGYSRLYGLETVALRYFNVFGPRQDPGSVYSGVLSIFISKMLRGEAPCIYGDGSASRDFVYVEDLVQANLLAAKAESRVTGRTFNVATGKPTTLLEAYRLVKELTGFEGLPVFGPERAGDIKHSFADISLIREALGFEVTTEFRRGLESTIAWHREGLRQP